MKKKSVKNMERFIELHELFDYKTWRIKMDLKKREILVRPTIYGNHSRTKFWSEIKSLNLMKIPFKKSLEFSPNMLKHLLHSKKHGEANLKYFKEDILGKFDAYCLDYVGSKNGRTLTSEKITLEFLENIVFEWKEQKRFSALTLKIINTGKTPKHRPFNIKVEKRGVYPEQLEAVFKGLSKAQFDAYFRVLGYSPIGNSDIPSWCNTLDAILKLESFGFNFNGPKYHKIKNLSVFNDLGDYKTA